MGKLETPLDGGIRRNARHLPHDDRRHNFGVNQAAEIEQAQQMVTSLDNLANAAVQKNDTVEKLVVANKQLTDTITKLQEDNAKLLHIIQQMAGQTPRTSQHQQALTRYDPKAYCHTHGYKVTVGHTIKTCHYQKPGHQDNTTQQQTMGGNQDNKGWQPK